jgi:hypothetical protein
MDSIYKAPVPKYMNDPKVNKLHHDPKKHQMGGSVYPVNYVPEAQDGKLTFLQPTSDKLPQGYRIPYADPSSELAMSIGGENGEPAYLIPSFKYGKPLDDPMEEFRKTGEHLGGPFKTWQEADKWENETRHPAVEKGENIMFPQEQFAMGGSIPGAVGFSYARTQGAAPSKGPHRNKVDVTDASAQNGKEMQYYQNGLDFKPKSISKNGAWLDNYEQAEDGDWLDKWRESHPSIRSMRNDTMNRKIQQSKGRGKETTVTQKDNTRTVTPKIGKIATTKEKKQRAIEENKQAQEASSLQAHKDWVQGSMEEAYKSPLMSPGYFTPEGAAIGALQGATKMGPDLYEGDYKAAAMDALMMLPFAPHTWTINPWAEKLNSANKSYRVAGLDNFKDFNNTGVLRSQRILPENATLADRLKARSTSFPSFQKGYADLNYLPEEGGVIFETALPTFKRGQKNPVTGVPIGGRHYAHRVIDPKTGNALREIPSSEIKAFGDKPHWLQGYKEVPKQEDGGIIKDDRGQWDHPGKITEIGSNEITMQGVPYDVLGISDTGDTKLMKPGKNYKFKGKKVTEYPMAKNGLRQEQKGLQNLDNLTNFTNYNKPQPGGWLNKYN